MRVHGVLVAILLLTTVFAATAAPAAVMVYTDRASFEAAIGPHVTYTFDSADGFPTAPDRVSTFGPVSAWDRVVGQAAYLRGWPTSSGNQTISGIYDDVVTQRLLLTFDPPQNVIGFDMYTFGASGVARIHFNDGSGQFFDVGQSITYSTFLGLTSTDPIVDLVVENAGDSRSQRYKGIDNFTIILEPSFWSLGALIVAVQGLFHRRRESRPRLIPRRASWPNDCEILDHRLHLSATGTFTGTYDLNVDNEVNTTYTPALHADFSQAEQAIAIDPNNPARMFVFANDGRPSGSGSHPPDNGMFAAYSVDAGATWHFMVADGLVGTGAIGDPFGSTVLRGDPSVIFDQYGNLFIASLADSANGRILTLALSTDGGQTIADQWQLTTGSSPDQPTVVVGHGSKLDPTDPNEIPTPESVWVTYAVQPSTGSEDELWQIAAQGASVSGLGLVGSFSTEQLVALGSDGTDVRYQNYGDIAVGPEGQVIVTYQDARRSQGPNGIYVALDPDGLGPAGFLPEQFVTETNVGAWDAIPAQPDRLIGAEAGVAWDNNPNSLHYGRLYLAYVDEAGYDESDDTDILVRYVDDVAGLFANPTTDAWSDAYRANDDDTTRSQFMPKIAIDYDTGFIGLSWYDCRLDDGLLNAGLGGDLDGIANTDTNFYATIGIPGSTSGITFLTNVRVSSGTSNQRQEDAEENYAQEDDDQDGREFEDQFFDYGDYTGLAFIGGSLFPAWADNSGSLHNDDFPRDGQGNIIGDRYYDIYTARVTLLSSSGQSLTLTGTAGADDLSVSLDPSGTFVQLWNSATHTGRPAFTASLAALTSITVDGLDGDDTLAVASAHAGTAAAALSLTSSSLGISYSGINPLPVDHSNIEHRAFSLSAGAYTLDTDNASWTPLSISLDHDASLTLASTQHLAFLTLADTATATIADDPNAPDTARVLFAGTLSIDPAASLDIGLNALVANAPDSAALALLAGYFAGGRITSSASSVTNGWLLGVHGPLDLTVASDHPLGILVSADQVLFRYTTLGDATGDGVVDLSDLNAVLNNFGFSATQLTFHLGDTNDDGIVDLTDLNNVLNDFGNTIFIT